MVIEVLTFVSLVVVLLIKYVTTSHKYVTTSHMSALRQELGELATEHRRCRGRKALILERIQEADSKEHDLQGIIRTLEFQLDELQRKLMEMETRNSELREQIDVTW